MSEQKSVFIGDIEVNNEKPLIVIAGPCVIESEEMIMQTAEELKRITDKLGIKLIFKSSFEKANRSSPDSFTGPGREEGLKILAKVKERFGIPVITDIHSPEDARVAAEVVDVLQIPAFLCRQTDLAQAAKATGKAINVKKNQAIEGTKFGETLRKYEDDGDDCNVMQCERGMTFGPGALVVDYSRFGVMKDNGHPLIMDATHAAQAPGGAGKTTGGNRQVVVDLARAAVGVGVAGVFLEIHPDVKVAKCDQANQLPLHHAEELLTQLKQIDNLVKSQKPIIITE